MTRAEMIAELRRSAQKDARPWVSLKFFAYRKTYEFMDESEHVIFLEDDDCRTFLLLVACALEDE